MAAMTYEEMERALAEATLSSFAHTPVVKSVTVPAVKSHDAMLIQSVVRAVAPHIIALEKQIAELQARVLELESAQGEMKYCGVWREGKEYTSGSFVTHDGALFHANRKTSARPGDSANGSWPRKVGCRCCILHAAPAVR